tara:strand:- start:396 stop:1361 length:966 start_codon:yes stop_codon:yes gene_type:complete
LTNLKKASLFSLVVIILFSCGGGGDGGIEPPSDGGNPISNSGSSNSSSCTPNTITTPNISFSRSLDPLTQPQSSNQYPPYDKIIDYEGIIFAGMDDVSNDFVYKVTQTYRELLGGDNGMKSSWTADLINKMDDKSVLQRIIYGEYDDYSGDRAFDERNYPGFDNTHDNNPNVDVIGESKPIDKSGQVNEVIEHILHTITVLGFNYIFPEKYSYTNACSDVYLAMQEAISKGYYDVSSYDDIKNDSEIYGRIIVQEFAYWMIITGWDIKKDLLPNSAPEWTINSATEMQSLLPLSHALYEETVKDILKNPTSEFLLNLFPRS